MSRWHRRDKWIDEELSDHLTVRSKPARFEGSLEEGMEAPYRGIHRDTSPIQEVMQTRARELSSVHSQQRIDNWVRQTRRK